MNTLDELRGTLTRHADELEDAQRYVRPVAVRARIRTVRRRRAGGAAAAFAVVAVTGVAAVSTLDGPDPIQPAGPSVVGVEVPRQVSVAGFPYALERTAAVTPGEGLRLDRSDQELAVSLVASDLGSGSATLLVDGEAVARARGGEDVELPVPVGSGQRLRVRLDGAGPQSRAGVAVYESTGELAEGVDNGTAVFRRSVAGSPLLTAAFAPEGAGEVTVTFRGRLSEARFASYCTTTEKGLWLNVEVDDDGPISGPCQVSDARDAASSWSSFEDDHPATRHTVRAYLTHGSQGPEVDAAQAELGVGVYEQPADTREVQGMTVDPLVEYAGRTWQLVEVDADGATRLDVRGTDRLLGFVAEGPMVRARWVGALDRGGSSYLGSSQGPARMVAGVLLAGDRYDVRLVDSRDRAVPGSLLIYRPV